MKELNWSLHPEEPASGVSKGEATESQQAGVDPLFRHPISMRRRPQALADRVSGGADGA